MHTDLTAIDQLEALGVTVELPRTSQAVRRHRKLDPTRTAALHLTY